MASGKGESELGVKIVIESHARHFALTRDLQDFGTADPIHADVADVNRITAFRSQQYGRFGREPLVGKTRLMRRD